MSQLFTDFPELSEFSREDLEDLLEDPQYYDAILNNLPRVKAMNQAQQELANANQAIAQSNHALSDQLYKLRAETKEAFEEALRLEARQKVLEREQREIYSRYDPSFLLLRLRHATTDQDELSEATATAFVKSETTTDGTREMDEFVKEFRELRKLYHKRKMWGDRWSAGDVQWRDY